MSSRFAHPEAVERWGLGLGLFLARRAWGCASRASRLGGSRAAAGAGAAEVPLALGLLAAVLVLADVSGLGESAWDSASGSGSGPSAATVVFPGRGVS
ncbi:MAG: hypothetical protein ABJA93_11515 [Sporichthyaceae bacterium]